jgi:hypothetical protein
LCSAAQRNSFEVTNKASNWPRKLDRRLPRNRTKKCPNERENHVRRLNKNKTVCAGAEEKSTK